jgi:hypothetical protein
MEGEEMKDKIAEMIADIFLGEPEAYSIKAADQILALFKDAELKWYNAGWERVKE